MGFRSLAFVLFAILVALFHGACQGASAGPIAVPTAALGAIPTLPPTATAVPAPSSRREQSAAKTDVPTSVTIVLPTPTPQPTRTVDVSEAHLSSAQPADERGQSQGFVFYEHDGLTLEYYWPLEDQSNLSGDETEILAYNESTGVIEFKTPKIVFTENGDLRAQFSGTWEKFPTRYSWDLIEYRSFPPLPTGENLLSFTREKKRKYTGI